MADSKLFRGGLSTARGIVELCGRHPFVTGLLGLFGVAFSFFTFGLDRIEAAQEEKEKKELASTVKAVETKVAAIASDAVDKPRIDPIEATFKKSEIGFDNVAFPKALEGRSMEWILKNSTDSFSNIPYLQFSIRSAANREYVQIAPYLIIEVLSVSPIPEDLAALYEPGRGAGAELRSFSAALPAKKGYHYAVLVDDMTGELRKDIAYFSLQPREPEEFFLSLSYEPGFIFTYRVGIHYRFEGEDSVHWVTGPLRSGIPNKPLPVAILDGREGEPEFGTQMHPDMEHADPERFLEDAKRFQSATSRGKVFNPRQLATYRSNIH